MQSIKYLIILAATIMYLATFVPTALAVPAPPAPVCQIEGQILEVNKTKIALKITKMTTYQDEDQGWVKCDENYKSSIEKSGVSYFDIEKMSLDKNMIIKALVHSGGDEWTGIVTRLYNVEILSRPGSNSNWFSTIFLRIGQFFKTFFK